MPAYPPQKQGMAALEDVLPATIAQPTKGMASLADVAAPTYGSQQFTPETLKQLASQFGLQMTSAKRTPPENRAAGGSPASNHLYDRAYDFSGDKAKMRQFAEQVRNLYGSNVAELFHQDISIKRGQASKSRNDHNDHVHIAWGDTQLKPKLDSGVQVKKLVPKVQSTSSNVEPSPALSTIETTLLDKFESAKSQGDPQGQRNYASQLSEYGWKPQTVTDSNGTIWWNVTPPLAKERKTPEPFTPTQGGEALYQSNLAANELKRKQTEFAATDTRSLVRKGAESLSRGAATTLDYIGAGIGRGIENITNVGSEITKGVKRNFINDPNAPEPAPSISPIAKGYGEQMKDYYTERASQQQEAEALRGQNPLSKLTYGGGQAAPYLLTAIAGGTPLVSLGGIGTLTGGSLAFGGLSTLGSYGQGEDLDKAILSGIVNAATVTAGNDFGARLEKLVANPQSQHKLVESVKGYLARGTAQSTTLPLNQVGAGQGLPNSIEEWGHTLAMGFIFGFAKNPKDGRTSSKLNEIQRLSRFRPPDDPNAKALKPKELKAKVESNTIVQEALAEGTINDVNVVERTGTAEAVSSYDKHKQVIEVDSSQAAKRSAKGGDALDQSIQEAAAHEVGKWSHAWIEKNKSTPEFKQQAIEWLESNYPDTPASREIYDNILKSKAFGDSTLPKAYKYEERFVEKHTLTGDGARKAATEGWGKAVANFGLNKNEPVILQQDPALAQGEWVEIKNSRGDTDFVPKISIREVEQFDADTTVEGQKLVDKGLPKGLKDSPVKVMSPEEFSQLPIEAAYKLSSGEVVTGASHGDIGSQHPEVLDRSLGAVSGVKVGDTFIPIEALEATYGDYYKAYTNTLGNLGTTQSTITTEGAPPTQGQATLDDIVASADPSEIKERSFPKTLESANLPKGQDLTYTVLTNAETKASASELVQSKGIDGTIEHITSSSELSAEQLTAGMQVISELQQQALASTDKVQAATIITKAQNLADDLAVKLTKQGQAIQAVNIIDAFSPERAMMTAQKILTSKGRGQKLTTEQALKVTKAATEIKEAQAKVDSLSKQLAEMQAKLDESIKSKERNQSPYGSRNKFINKQQYEQTLAYIKEATKTQRGSGGIGADLQKAYAEVGAYHLEAGARSIAEWTTKMIDELGEAVRPYLEQIKVDAYNLIKEKRASTKSTSQPTAYGEVGKELRQKASEVKKLERKETLAQNRYDYQIKQEAASAQARLKSNNTLAPIDDLIDIGAEKLLQIGYNKDTKTLYTQEDWANDMVKLYGDKFKSNAREVLKGSVDKIEEAKYQNQKRLEHKRLTKIMEDDTNLNLEQAVTLQRELEHQKRKGQEAKKELAKLYQSLDRWGQIKRELISIANLPRALKSSLDLSAAGRQGWIFTVTHPSESAKSFGNQLQALTKWTPEQFRKFEEDLYSDPEFRTAQKSGVDFTLASSDILHTLSKGEEAFMTNLAGKIPLVAQSEQAYVTFLNTQRLRMFKLYAKELQSKGLTYELAPHEFEGVSKFINNATGRGRLGGLEGAAPILNSVLFSPRWIASRLTLLNPIYYAKMPKATRIIALREAIKFTGVLAGTLFLLDKSGAANVTLNPDDPDFLKVRIGTAHYDISGGFANEIRNILRAFKAVENQMRTNPKSDRPNLLEVEGDYLRKKLSPVMGYGVSAATGTTLRYDDIGHREKFEVKRDTLDLFSPLVLGEFREAYQKEKGKGVLKAAPGFFGIGTQVYQPKKIYN